MTTKMFCDRCGRELKSGYPFKNLNPENKDEDFGSIVMHIRGINFYMCGEKDFKIDNLCLKCYREIKEFAQKCPA